jgi:hypothetical protein
LPLFHPYLKARGEDVLCFVEVISMRENLFQYWKVCTRRDEKMQRDDKNERCEFGKSQSNIFYRVEWFVNICECKSILSIKNIKE